MLVRTATEQLVAYRSRHKIDPTLEVILPLGSRRWMCGVDGLRVHEHRVRGRYLYRHDADEIKRLVRAAAMPEGEARAMWGNR